MPNPAAKTSGIDEAVVEEFVARIGACLARADGFEAAIASFDRDPRVGPKEATAVARRVHATAMRTLSKPAAVRALIERHRKAVDAEMKRASISGRAFE